MAAKFYCQFCGKALNIFPWDYESFQEGTGACALVCEDCCNGKFNGDCGRCILHCTVLRGVILERHPEYSDDMVVLPMDNTLPLTEEPEPIEPPEDYVEEYDDDYPDYPEQEYDPDEEW